MPDEIVKVENGGVQLALGRFASNLRQRSSLLKELAAGMLVSVRRTFREQGVPANSWAPLAESTLRKKPNGPGRKILIVSGRLLNSIQAESDDHSITIGTNLVYARVQQEGSADRGSAVIGPQVRYRARVGGFTPERSLIPVEQSGMVSTGVRVKGHRRYYLTELGKGRHEVTDKNGRRRVVTANIQGP